jgi:hypothetical protein
MSHPTKAQRLVRDARDGRPVQRVEIPHVTCERCHQEEIYADANGQPRPHLRPAVQGDQGGQSWYPCG